MRDARKLWRFRALTWLVGKLVLWMAHIAANEGDLHELRHLHAQLEAGNTDDCDATCPLRAVRAG